MIQFIPDFNSECIRAEYGADALAYRLSDSDALCVFAVSGARVRILSVKGSTEPVLYEGLVRAALGAAANRGAYTAEALPGADTSGALSRLGFVPEGDLLVADIPDVLMCSCHREGAQ